MCDLVIDTAGFSGRERLTCNTHGKTLVHQPYMVSAQWEGLKAAFLSEHPSAAVPEVSLAAKPEAPLEPMDAEQVLDLARRCHASCFHEHWSRAADLPGYCKSDWVALQRRRQGEKDRV